MAWNKLIASRSSTLGILFGAALLAGSPATAFAEPLYVKVKTSKVRSRPDLLAPAVIGVSYGDAVDKVSQEGAWVRVTAKGKSGYLHQSALDSTKIVLSSSAVPKSTGADASDVVLAGKGFNKEVEQRYASEHGRAAFASVDEVERLTVSEQEIVSFVKEGGLQKQG